MEVNFSEEDLRGGSGKPLPPEGEYELTVVAAEPGTSQAGNEQFRIKLTNEDESVWVNDFLTKSPRGMKFLARRLQALGFDLSQPVKATAQNLVGKKARVRLVHESYTRQDGTEGKRLKVADYLTDEPAPEESTAAASRPRENGSPDWNPTPVAKRHKINWR